MEPLVNEKFKNVGVIILAAGRGTRLNMTDKPKVMLPLNNRPIVSYIVETLKRLGFSSEQICLVVGFQADSIKQYFKKSVSYAMQTEQKGTAHAAYVGSVSLPERLEHLLVLNGDDSAFYTAESLKNFLQKYLESGTDITLLSAVVEQPSLLGRVIRDEKNNFVALLEKELLNEEQKKLKEISTGTFAINRVWYEMIFPSMPKIGGLNEFGLPMALKMAHDTERKLEVVQLANPKEWFGINTKEEYEAANLLKQNE